MGQIQLLPYLTVRQPFGRHLRNLQLLRCELIASVWCASLAALASCTELLPSAVTPRQGAQCIERRACRAKQIACLDDTPADATPLAVPGSVTGRLDADSDLHDVYRLDLRAGVGVIVKMSGFGNFNIRRKAPRPGRNPRTGEAIPIKARNVVTFHASHKLKGVVQGDIPSGEEFE